MIYQVVLDISTACLHFCQYSSCSSCHIICFSLAYNTSCSIAIHSSFLVCRCCSCCSCCSSLCLPFDHSFSIFCSASCAPLAAKQSSSICSSSFCYFSFYISSFLFSNSFSFSSFSLIVFVSFSFWSLFCNSQSSL